MKAEVKCNRCGREKHNFHYKECNIFQTIDILDIMQKICANLYRNKLEWSFKYCRKAGVDVNCLKWLNKQVMALRDVLGVTTKTKFDKMKDVKAIMFVIGTVNCVFNSCNNYIEKNEMNLINRCVICGEKWEKCAEKRNEICKEIKKKHATIYTDEFWERLNMGLTHLGIDIMTSLTLIYESKKDKDRLEFIACAMYTDFYAIMTEFCLSGGLLNELD